MTTASQPARYSAIKSALASGFAAIQLHHLMGHDHVVGFAQYVPEKLRRIIRKAVASDPSVRYSTTGAFRQDLSRLNPARHWRPINETTWTCEYAGIEEVIRLIPAQYATILHTIGGKTRSKTVHANRQDASNHMLSIVAKSTLQ